MRASLVWNDENYGVQGFNVYRDTQTLDPEALPSPLASLGPEARAYEDETVVEGVTYHYMVTALVDGQEPATASFEILAEEPDEVPTYEVFEATGTGREGLIQSFTVPSSGLYRAVAHGAQGGTGPRQGVGGRGAKMSGWFHLLTGQVLEIGVGHQGNTIGNADGPSGGGASWIALDGQPLVVSGGGGGYGVGNSLTYQERAHAHTETYGKDGWGGSSWGAGGSDGQGGEGASTRGCGGGGWLSDGSGGTTVAGGGQALSEGGLGGDGGSLPDGGFGGGGANDQATGWGACGGGGGYSGGGGCYASSAAAEGVGGGGGSYNAGTDQDNEGGVNEGDGYVLIYNASGLASQG